tara:strand:- start:1875 stop:2102 length:228 start_codon:yes stop_codon:yes gene_type:complete
MKAYGDFTIIKPVQNLIGGHILVKGDCEAIVHSCPTYPELEGKKILYDDRHKYTEYKDYYIIRTEYIQALLEELE